MGKIFCVEFQKGTFKNPHKILYTYIERYDFLYNIEILRALRFKSSWVFLKCPLVPVNNPQGSIQDMVTHWGQATHICIGKLTIIGSDNGLSPGRHQAIIRTNAGILLIATFGTNFSEILSEIDTFSFIKMHLKMSSGRWRPFCLGLNVLKCVLKCGSQWWRMWVKLTIT